MKCPAAILVRHRDGTYSRGTRLTDRGSRCPIPEKPTPGKYLDREPVGMNRGAEPATAADFEPAAAALLPAEVWDFVAGGSGAETTLAANRAALDSVFLVPRVLRDVSSCSTRSTLLGRPVELPVAAAPVAYQQLIHPDGESATARAAAAAGVPFIVSALSSVPIEHITELGGRVWFQFYWLRDHVTTLDLVRRAEDAGCEALVLTADTPWLGRRLRDFRN